MPTGGNQAERGLVSRADRGLAEGQLPLRSDYEGVPRDDLLDPVHPGAGSVEARARGAPARTRSLRRPKGAKRAKGQGHIVDAVSIRERPAEAEDRAIPGHWEGDLIAGGANTHVATLVERHSRFVMLVALDGKDTSTVTQALSKHVRRLPHQLRSSLTWDRGTEMAAHARFTLATDVKVYFCDPQSPWQRGSNENTNGLLRQYLPTGTDLSLSLIHI